MKNGLYFFVTSLLLTLISLPNICLGLDAESLKQMINQGDKVTIIDIRDRNLYQAGHIRGAIHISGNIIARKPLPPVGKVVVCGDGVHIDLTTKAVDALNNKKGIQAESLQGGFAAWNSLNMLKTQKQGIVRQEMHYITYRELQQALESNKNMVLVDIRAFRKKTKNVPMDESKVKMSNIAALFPGVEIIKPEVAPQRFNSKKQRIAVSSFLKNQNTVYVIIDNGDGKAEEVARQLAGASIQQNLILLGGELILRRAGQAGSVNEITGQKL